MGKDVSSAPTKRRLASRQESRINEQPPNWIGGVEVRTYKEEINGVTVIRNKTFFKKRRKVSKKRKK